MRQKKYLISTSTFNDLAELGLPADVKWFYSMLTHNNEMTVCGLYSMSRRHAASEADEPINRVDEMIGLLIERSLIVHDKGIYFIPLIPLEQNLYAKRGWQEHLCRLRRDYAKCESAFGGINKAYSAFLEYYRDIFDRIDNDTQTAGKRDVMYEVENDTVNTDSNESAFDQALSLVATSNHLQKQSLIVSDDSTSSLPRPP